MKLVKSGQFPSIHVFGIPPPQICAIELRRYSCSTLARGKRKHIMRFEIRYFFLEIGLQHVNLFLEIGRQHVKPFGMCGENPSNFTKSNQNNPSQLTLFV